MVHDYHLYLAPSFIRRRRPGAVISHFTHIPWPPSSLWQVITPRIRTAIVEGLSAADVVGFQTERYAHNFLRAVESFLPGARVDHRTRRVLRADGHVAHVRHYPISLDVEATRGWLPRRALVDAGSSCEPAPATRSSCGSTGWSCPRTSCVASPSSCCCSATLAAGTGDHARLPGPVTDRPARVRRLRAKGAGRGRAHQRLDGRAGYRHVQLFYENDYPQAIAGLTIADVVLVNPLIDGMNLVAKEAALVNQRDAVLVLSETAGAYDQMAEHVLPVALADVAGTADALAVALAMPARERARRIAGLRRGRAPGHRLVAASQLEDMARIAAPRSTRR